MLIPAFKNADGKLTFCPKCAVMWILLIIGIVYAVKMFQERKAKDA